MAHPRSWSPLLSARRPSAHHVAAARVAASQTRGALVPGSCVLRIGAFCDVDTVGICRAAERRSAEDSAEAIPAELLAGAFGLAVVAAQEQRCDGQCDDKQETDRETHGVQLMRPELLLL